MLNTLKKIISESSDKVLSIPYISEDGAEALADHLISKGVIVTPCKVGDKLWIIGSYRGIYHATVRTFFFGENGVEMIRTTECDIPFCHFGKTVFLTREEAEKALKRSE